MSGTRLQVAGPHDGVVGLSHCEKLVNKYSRYLRLSGCGEINNIPSLEKAQASKMDDGFERVGDDDDDVKMKVSRLLSIL